MSATVESKLYSLEQAGELLGCSHWLLRKHADRGTVKTVRVGRLVKLSSEEVERIQRDGLPSLRTPK